MKKILFIFFLLFTVTSNAKNSQNPQVRAYRTNERIRLDGYLNESVYKNIPITDFTQKIPDEGKPATEESKIWITYDDENIYWILILNPLTGI